MSVDSLIGSLARPWSLRPTPARAPAMQAYMKSSMPYYGVSVPDLRRACRPVFADQDLGTAAEFEDAVRRLFVGATHREERYAAVNLALQRRYRMFQTPRALPLYADLIVAGAWWDTVDEIASNLIGPILLVLPARGAARGPELDRPTPTSGCAGRRSSCQLAFKDRTDLRCSPGDRPERRRHETSSSARRSAGRCDSMRAPTPTGCADSWTAGSEPCPACRNARRASASESRVAGGHWSAEGASGPDDRTVGPTVRLTREVTSIRRTRASAPFCERVPLSVIPRRVHAPTESRPSLNELKVVNIELDGGGSALAVALRAAAHGRGRPDRHLRSRRAAWAAATGADL